MTKNELRLGVTGSRHPITDMQRDKALVILRGFRDEGILWMHNGDCINADHEMARIWKRMSGMVYGHPPSNPIGRAYFAFDAQEDPKEYGKRDADIVQRANVMVAMPNGPERLRSGTWMTVRMARRKGLPITYIWPDGSVTYERPQAGGL
jgi:hypothetical protein